MREPPGFAVTYRPFTSSKSPRRSSAQSLAFARLSIRSKSAPDELPTRQLALSPTEPIGPMRPDVSLEGKLLANSSKYEGVGNHACSQPQNERVGHYRRRHSRDG